MLGTAAATGNQAKSLNELCVWLVGVRRQPRDLEPLTLIDHKQLAVAANGPDRRMNE